jgi:hypothetical protein
LIYPVNGAPDMSCFAFNDFIISNSLIIPESIQNALEKICDKVLDTDTLDSETKNHKTMIAEIERTIDNLLNEADQISKLLRNDLHIDELNSSSYKD